MSQYQDDHEPAASVTQRKADTILGDNKKRGVTTVQAMQSKHRNHVERGTREAIEKMGKARGGAGIAGWGLLLVGVFLH